MREFVFAVSFIVLLLIGFLATPGVFKVINPEYLLARHEYSVPLEKTVSDIREAGNKIFELTLEILTLTTDAVTAEDTNVKALKSAQATRLTGVRHMWEQRKQDLENTEADLKRKIEASAAESANLYLVTRALALGAIGALISIFASLLSISKARVVFDDKGALAKVWASMAIGAIVGVVMVGLFFTGFITIFAQTQQATGNPDFWKVTILCLLAGAFSDRLFLAASGKMERYLGSAAGDGPAGAHGDAPKASIPKSAPKKRLKKSKVTSPSKRRTQKPAAAVVELKTASDASAMRSDRL
jgi:hypothetical protein